MIYIIVYILKIIRSRINIAHDFNHGKRIVRNILCVPAVETAGYVFLTYLLSNIARGFNHGKRIVAHFQIQYCEKHNHYGYPFALLRLKPQAMFFFAYLLSNIARGFKHGKRIVAHFQIQYCEKHNHYGYSLRSSG